jgi:hypothetical protein
MAEFAKIGLNNIVLDVVCVSDNEIMLPDGRISEDLGISYLHKLLGHETWLLTKLDGSIRKNYAGIGYIYDGNLDAFISPKPFDSWILNNNCQWEAPIPLPNDKDNFYNWNEELKEWIKV